MYSRKELLLALALLMHLLVNGQTTLYSEGFETNGEGSRYTSNSYLLASPTCDFFEREPISPLNVCFGGVTFNSFRGNFFWASEDIMSSPGNRPPGNITSTSFSISGFSTLKVSLYAATSNDNGTRWESADSINIKVSFNGGSFITVGRFMGNGVVGGSLVIDANLNGVVDPGETTVVSIPAFTKYTFNIPGTGSTMRVQLDFDQLGGSEELGIDDIQVTGISTLPVKLLWFNASPSLNGSTRLSWMIDDQSDAVSFGLERSFNGRDFTSFSTITATNARTYSSADSLLLPGDVFYRLRMTDSRGVITYSSVVHVNRQTQGIHVKGIFPNPVKDQLVFVVSSPYRSGSQVIIKDAAGVRVLERNDTVLPGETGFTMDVSGLKAGFYYLTFIPERGEASSGIKFIKQ